MSSLDAFLGEPRNVIVVGIRKDGRPHASPNWYGWDGERFYVSTTRGRAKYKIFSRDPRVELVFDDPEGFRYVALSGTVEILEDIRLSSFSSRRNSVAIRTVDEGNVTRRATIASLVLIANPRVQNHTFRATGRRIPLVQVAH